MCRMMIEGKPAGFLGIVEVGRTLEAIDANIAERGANVLVLQILPSNDRSRARDRPATTTSPISCARAATRSIWCAADRSSGSICPSRTHWCG